MQGRQEAERGFGKRERTRKGILNLPVDLDLNLSLEPAFCIRMTDLERKNEVCAQMLPVDVVVVRCYLVLYYHSYCAAQVTGQGCPCPDT